MSDDTEAPKRTVPIDYGFSVFANDRDEICISQPDVFSHEETTVFISLERVDKLIQYLQEVRDELRADLADGDRHPSATPIRLT